MRREPQGLEKYANTDPSLHFNRIESRSGERRWQDDYMEALMDNNYESAHVIRLRNDPDYKLDCEEKARAERAHKPLRSCREVASEQEELEVA